MKTLFLAILACLIVFSQAVVLRRAPSAAETGVPVIYWSTMLTPSRVPTPGMFRAWLKRNGYPDMDLRIDTYNTSSSKVIVQSVSGVSPDLISGFSWDFQYYDKIGMLDDLGPRMRDLPVPGVSFDPQVSNDLFRDGKRLAYSVNAGTSLFFINREAFERLGMKPPASRWTIDEFEALGREWVAKANPGKPKLRKFFAENVDRETLRRSLGLSVLNETCTASRLGDPRHRELLARIQRWIREDRLLPSAADMDSMVQDASGSAGNWGGSTGLFHRGYWAMTFTARHVYIRLRELKPLMNLVAVESPHGGYPNCITRTYGVALAAGGKHKDLSCYFMLFLLSPEHNRWMTEIVDQMPPLPEFRKERAYTHPPAWTNEWGPHAMVADRFTAIGIGSEYSPFIHYTAYQQYERRAWDALMSGVLTPDQAVAEMSGKIDEEIGKAVARDAKLDARYREAAQRQRQIDALRGAGKKIPLALVDNAFLRRYYQDTGRGE
ncbi:MAG: carbohydrate ABC transporter substrate-binding protein [Spirochaetes bacterium]|nr:carbohydrate ABC transporter substrate-binding protein [Spirochaetota bacterium]